MKQAMKVIFILVAIVVSTLVICVGSRRFMIGLEEGMREKANEVAQAGKVKPCTTASASAYLDLIFVERAWRNTILKAQFDDKGRLSKDQEVKLTEAMLSEGYQLIRAKALVKIMEMYNEEELVRQTRFIRDNPWFLGKQEVLFNAIYETSYQVGKEVAIRTLAESRP